MRIRIRGQQQPASQAEIVTDRDAAAALDAALSHDVSDMQFPLIEVEAGDIHFLDLDTHHLTNRPDETALASWAMSITPAPHVWWSTHGQGLRLAYVGPEAERRATAAALSVPEVFTVELKQDSRHPAGGHPKYPGAQCGPIQRNPGAPSHIDYSQLGRLDDRAIDDLLAELELSRGGRYPHERCPIDGDASSDAQDCVVVLDHGIFCHRCAAKGLTYNDSTKAGFVPFTALTSKNLRAATPHHLAKNFVHWAHAKLQLQHEYPHLKPQLLHDAYNWVLEGLYSKADPRVKMVFDRDLMIIQGQHGWLDLETLRPFSLTEATFNYLPALHDAIKNGDGILKKKLRGPLLDRAKNGLALTGYTPIRVYRGIQLVDDQTTVPLVRGPEHGEPIKLLKGPDLIAEQHAIAELQRAFPKIDQTYLCAVLAARICAAHGGRPPILAVVGPTGSGKGETLRLAASFCGDKRHAVALSAQEEPMWRSIGSANAEGRGFILFDEFLRRTRQRDSLTALLLQLSADISWRKLFSTEDTQTSNQAAYFLAAGCVPDNFKKSPELRRRMKLVHLKRQVPNWSDFCGGDTASWRDRSDRNARVANSILTHVYNLCAEHDNNFDKVAEVLGLHTIDEGEAALQEATLRDLYRHCRNEFGDRESYEGGKRYGAGRWVNAMSGPCHELMEQLVPDEDTGGDNEADKLFQLRQNLEMVDWNNVLGIEEPSISFETARHGRKIAIRFIECNKMRGTGRVNEDLPRIPDGGATPPPDETDDPDEQTPPTPTDPNDPAGPLDQGSGEGGEPNAESDASYCQLCQQGWQNSNPSHRVKNADNQPPTTRSASYASYASLSEKSGGKENERRQEGRASSLSPKTLAELAERADDPKNGDSAASPAGRTVAQPLAEPATREGGRGAVGEDDQSNAASALITAGMPAQLLTLDFETYFDRGYTLKGNKLTIPEYVQDHRFHVHGLAIRHPDGRCVFRTDVSKALDDLRSVYGEQLEAVTVVAHNMPFDGYILAKKFGLRPTHVTDTLSMARHVFPGATNSLDALAGRLGLGSKGDELKGLVGVRELDVAQIAELTRYAKNDANLCFEIAIRLLPRISRPDVELPLIAHTVRLFTERGIPFDDERAQQLVRQAQGQLDAALGAAGLTQKEAGGKECEELLRKELAKDDRSLPTKPGKNGPIAALAKDDEAMEQLLNDPNTRIRKLAEARLAVKSAPQLNKKLEKMIRMAQANDGVMPIDLKYCGAHTGRYSGNGGVNLQNLPAHVPGLASQIRGLFRAGNGHKLVIADASQIEARVLAWWASELGLIQSFAEGRDVYSEFISDVLGTKVRKSDDDDSPELRNRLKALRQLGKRAILGLGYGMGQNKFLDTLQKDPAIRELMDRGEVDDALLRQIHRSYRDTYCQIEQLWSRAQGAFRATIYGTSSVVNGVTFARRGDDVEVQLPTAAVLVELSSVQ